MWKSRDSSKLGLYILFWAVFYALAIFQDYLASELGSTGFYWSDTMLYNTYWLWFIPLMYVGQKIYTAIKAKGILLKILSLATISLVFTAVHIFLFAQVFVFISEILYSNPHRFSRILESALSNQVYITLITYAFAPLLVDHFKGASNNKAKEASKFTDVLTVRKGNSRIPIKVVDIQAIIANKPYSEITANGNKYLHKESLKKLEGSLDPKLFLRVHRAVLVNKMHIVELISRGNGDYDAQLANGDSVRFSRHYREHWAMFTTTEE